MHDRQALMQRAVMHCGRLYPEVMKNLEAAALAYVRYVLRREAMSPRALAERAGISPTTLTRPLNDPSHKFALSMTTVDKIAKATGISFAPFASGETEVAVASAISQQYATDPMIYADPGEEQKSVAILGDVAAGNWREVDVSDVTARGEIYLNHSMFGAENCFGLVVHGSSINRVAQDGDVLFCVKTDAYDRPLEPGDLVVVERKSEDGRKIEISAKRLRGSSPRWELWPDSDDKRWQDRVEILPADETDEATVVGVVLYVVREPVRKK